MQVASSVDPLAPSMASQQHPASSSQLPAITKALCMPPPAQPQTPQQQRQQLRYVLVMPSATKRVCDSHTHAQPSLPSPVPRTAASTTASGASQSTPVAPPKRTYGSQRSHDTVNPFADMLAELGGPPSSTQTPQQQAQKQQQQTTPQVQRTPPHTAEATPTVAVASKAARADNGSSQRAKRLQEADDLLDEEDGACTVPQPVVPEDVPGSSSSSPASPTAPTAPTAATAVATPPASPRAAEERAVSPPPSPLGVPETDVVMEEAGEAAKVQASSDDDDEVAATKAVDQTKPADAPTTATTAAADAPTKPSYSMDNSSSDSSDSDGGLKRKPKQGSSSRLKPKSTPSPFEPTPKQQQHEATAPASPRSTSSDSSGGASRKGRPQRRAASRRARSRAQVDHMEEDEAVYVQHQHTTAPTHHHNASLPLSFPQHPSIPAPSS